MTVGLDRRGREDLDGERRRAIDPARGQRARAVVSDEDEIRLDDRRILEDDVRRRDVDFAETVLPDVRVEGTNRFPRTFWC